MTQRSAIHSGSMDRAATEEDDFSVDLRLARSLEEDVKAIREFVVSLTTEVSSSDDHGRDASVSAAMIKLQAITEKYQEQGQLLEPHLEGILGPLMDTLQSKVVEANNVADTDLNAVKTICRIVHAIVTVSGYKTVVKFFPHQACNLEDTVTLLERCHKEVTLSSILKEESTGDWETQCTLLLWLSIVVLIPFDMASVDTALTDPSASCGNSPEEIPPLVERIMTLCKEYLASPGPVREMAGVLLARLLCRPDMSTALKYFVSWTREALDAAEDAGTSPFLVAGIVGVLAAIFKVGGRDTLQEATSAVWEVASLLVNSSSASRSPLLRKLLVKLIHRIGLAHLPQRPVQWRYKQSDRSLVCNLGSQSLKGERSLVSERPSSKDLCEEFLEEDASVPEIIEEVIEHQLNGLRDKVTVVRWSAAKGVGRVTGRLSLALADEVVSSVLELFQPTEGDGAWHGGCLALAELARRGLLLPERLSTVVPIIAKALHYDVRRGPHSVGSHVRDAAAYVTWAFARTYSSILMKDHLRRIAPALLTTACYDREVNCRRAAAAAFQECVGRQGDFEHGIDLVNAADYFSLGTRSHAYLVVAVQIAQYKEYLLPMVEEILNTKVSHWEKAIRELAAGALSLLVRYDGPYFEQHVLNILLPWTLSPDLGQRHGATLGAAEVIKELHHCKVQFSAEKAKSIAEVVPAIEKARLYRGKGGEIMRAAVSRFIECTAIVRVPLSPKVQKVLLDSIDENLRHPNADIQARAVAALKAFVQGYMVPATAPAVTKTTLKYLKTLKTYNPAAQRGAALALGALSFDLLAPAWRDVIDALCSALALRGIPAEEDAETRVNAVRALIVVSETICSSGSILDLGVESPILVVKRKVMPAFFSALDDYAIDNRGDVGSWIREAAIEGIERCTYILCQPSLDMHEALIKEKDPSVYGSDINGHPKQFDEETAIHVIGGVVKQAVEKIDRVRNVAGRALQRLLHNPGVSIPNIPHHGKLKLVIEDSPFLNWAAPADSFPRLVQFFSFPEYRPFLLSGLVVSIGGLADSLGKISGGALVDFLKSTCTRDIDRKETTTSSASHCTTWLGEGLSQVLVDYAGNDRVVVPTLKTLEILFNRSVLLISQPRGDAIAAEILNSIALELHGCKDVTKLLAGVSVLSHFAALKGSARTQAMPPLLHLLFHRYPKVRKFCAEQIYLLLIQVGDELVGGAALDKAMDMIGETCWDGELADISGDRDEIYSLFQIDLSPIEPFYPASRGQGPQKRMSKPSDENDNYATLVDAAGY